MILMTGATGTVGSEVVKRLSAQGVHVRAVTRDPQKVDAPRLPHMHVVHGDFEDVESMRRACAGVDRAFDEGERRRLDPPQRVDAVGASAVGAERLRPGRVQADEPVGLLAAVRRIAQAAVGVRRLQVPETGEDRLARERRDPQALDGLAAARQRVHEIEDQLPLTPSVRRVDDRGHVCPPEQVLENGELVEGFRAGVIGERGGEEREIRQPPLLPRRVVRLWLVQLDHVSDTPGDEIVGPLQVAVAAGGRAEGHCDVAPHRRLLCNDQSHDLCGLPLPVYFLADEKHSRCLTDKVYLPTIVCGRVLWHLGYTEAASTVAFTRSYREFQQAALQQEPSYRVRGILTDGFDSTTSSMRMLFPGARLGNCLRHALNKLPKKLVAIASPVRKALRTQFHTLLYRARQRKGLRVFALGQWLRHFADHVTNTAGMANGARVRQWFQEKKAGWYAVLADPQMPMTSTLLDQAHNAIERKLFAMKGFHHPGGSQQAFLTGLAHLYNLISYQRRAQHAGQCGVEVEGGRVPTPDWMLNLQILTSGGFR